VESVAAEVNRVVDLVFEHIRHRPSFSLAVVTASPRHAARVGEAIRLQMVNFPWAADFFAPGRESFRWCPWTGRRPGRDDVIFSLGFGRTPHGRAVHSFGPLSPRTAPEVRAGDDRARRRLHVLTCFQPTDLDPERLSAGAATSTSSCSANWRLRTGGNPGVEQHDPLVADLVERLRAACAVGARPLRRRHRPTAGGWRRCPGRRRSGPATSAPRARSRSTRSATSGSVLLEAGVSSGAELPSSLRSSS
jgi:hypothetical protein